MVTISIVLVVTCLLNLNFFSIDCYKKACGNENASGKENACGNELLIYARGINDTYSIHFT
jgi:hypothetical protein